MYVIAALYQFAPLPDCADRRQDLLTLMKESDVRGTILIAPEGVNGTVAGSRDGIDAVLAHIRGWPGCSQLEHKESYAVKAPFRRPKVKIKQEIVTMGVPGVDPNEIVGEYVPPQEWNALLSDPDVVLIDTRNDYEVLIGTFKNAINPNTSTFREFPDWVQQNPALDPAATKVAMFCTGGIRCEKASSYMRQQGFSQVYHLQGGILKYLEEIPPEESLWEGECFVFDERVAVSHGLAVGQHQRCYGCGDPVSPEDLTSPLYLKGIHCPHCHDELTEDKRQRLQERQNQIDLATLRHQAQTDD